MEFFGWNFTSEDHYTVLKTQGNPMVNVPKIIPNHEWRCKWIDLMGIQSFQNTNGTERPYSPGLKISKGSKQKTSKLVGLNTTEGHSIDSKQTKGSLKAKWQQMSNWTNTMKKKHYHKYNNVPCLPPFLNACKWKLERKKLRRRTNHL